MSAPIVIRRSSVSRVRKHYLFLLVIVLTAVLVGPNFLAMLFRENPVEWGIVFAPLFLGTILGIIADARDKLAIVPGLYVDYRGDRISWSDLDFERIELDAAKRSQREKRFRGPFSISLNSGRVLYLNDQDYSSADFERMVSFLSNLRSLTTSASSCPVQQTAAPDERP